MIFEGRVRLSGLGLHTGTGGPAWQGRVGGGGGGGRQRSGDMEYNIYFNQYSILPAWT